MVERIRQMSKTFGTGALQGLGFALATAVVGETLELLRQYGANHRTPETPHIPQD